MFIAVVGLHFLNYFLAGVIRLIFFVNLEFSHQFFSESQDLRMTEPVSTAHLISHMQDAQNQTLPYLAPNLAIAADVSLERMAGSHPGWAKVLHSVVLTTLGRMVHSSYRNFLHLIGATCLVAFGPVGPKRYE